MTSRIRWAIAASGAALAWTALAVPGAQAAQLINNGSQGYYNSSLGDLYPGNPGDPLAAYFPGPNVSTGDPTATFAVAPDLSGVAALGSWLSDPVNALTNVAWSGLQSIPLTWAVNSETAILYEIDGGPKGIDNLIGRFGVDNGIFVWVNGVYKFGATAAGGAPVGEYAPIALGSLGAGKNYIQILRADHGGGTGYDVSITGDLRPVPEPGTLGALAVAGGLGLLASKKRSADRPI
ncbi:PEP-CTERM sorting domain-containing protein [Geitlerinema sp. PCC 7407]|uniref:PEP-CTERM sorting domain-containing protein n=1 Tax=Geitlerinema sp. PCC 7407 TaxID=1173025 RepID=UPI00029FA5A8|nr:PEP-CTERM sorting domain-containing protein [Geitlerinema sp. PCC 7407]AFY65674.1 protein of unknown function DUF1555 [Geitlerinema sp. PCC 7407]